LNDSTGDPFGTGKKRWTSPPKWSRSALRNGGRRPDNAAPRIERVHRQRDCPAALSPTDFENVEVAADQANPNEKNEHAIQDAIEDAPPEMPL